MKKIFCVLMMAGLTAATTALASPPRAEVDEPPSPLQGTRGESEDYQAALKKRNEDLAALQQDIESRLGRIGDLTEIVPAIYNEVHSQVDRIELTLRGQKTKERAIQEKIAELTKQAEDQIARDPMAAALQKIAEQKQKDAERVGELARQKLVSTAEVDASVSQAAEALVHVQERKEAITAAVGGGVLPALSKELISISLDIAEQEALLSALGTRLNEVNMARTLYREWWRKSHEPLVPETKPANR